MNTISAPAPMPERYEPQAIEPRWQQVWDERRSFHAEDDDPRPKMYVLQMFPYPSGDLHAGHIRNYVLGDAAARYWRMRGYNVMHPMGFDSFGLPAEQAAIDRGIYPGEWIDHCIARARVQFRRYGFAFDWEREVITSDPAYYRWTQWLFLKFHALGLVYRSDFEVNWCEEHGVLANDEVKDGACWRCERPVTRRKLEQWVMRTTDFAQELLDNLDKLPGWNEAVRIMQRNWIGRSEGSHIDFEIVGVRPSLGAPALGVRASVPASGSEYPGRMQAQVDDLTIRKHRLPHWQLSGAVYFISWRLHPDQPPLSPEARDQVFSAITHFDGERYDLAAAVVMDDHVHVVVKLTDGQDLGKTLHSWRSFTGNRLQREFGYKGAVWQDEYFDRIIRNEEEYKANIEYILNNPKERWPDGAGYKWLLYRDIFGIKSAQGRAHSTSIRVFTTRIDTVFGATFMAIAPDHPLAAALAQQGGTTEALADFAASCAAEAAQYGPEDERPKRGLALNASCVNPFNGESIPVFATNYVIASFGTGAVMGVPAHDERDFAFAKEYGIEIRKVIETKGGRPSVAASSPPNLDDLQINRHRLPHWQLTGPVYFISWRLAPAQPPLPPQGRDIVLAALQHFDGERYCLQAAVVMDDHVHVLVRPYEGQELGKLLHSWRSFTANRLQRECGYQGTIWQEDYFDRIVRTEEEYQANLDYVLRNPLEKWPDAHEYRWLHLSGDADCLIPKVQSSLERVVPEAKNIAACDRLVMLPQFQDWFWRVADEFKHLIRDFEHGHEHFADRRAAYQVWFSGGKRPKLLGEAAYSSIVDALAPAPLATLLVGYLVLGRGAAKDYLIGRAGAFGFTADMQPDLGQLLLEDQEARRDARPPVDREPCTTEKGTCINSGQFDGLDFAAAKAAMDAWLAERGLGGTAVSFKLRDWNMSRQRFWGAPIPMVHCDACGWLPVPESELPVELPPRADYSDIRVSPLANDVEWQRARCPKCGGVARRETDTMTTFMDSAWYFLRFCDPLNNLEVFDPAKLNAWLPVDYYVGGKEHAVGHLLYSRFITMVLERAGLLELARKDHAGLPDIANEPFRRLLNQGIVYKDGAKMSKSKGNVVSADGLAADYGADTARLFSFFGGPYDMDMEWSTAGVEGCHRFLRRVWRLAVSVQHCHTTDKNGDPVGAFSTVEASPRAIDLAAMRARHKAVAGVTADVESWRFNTAIAKLMECLNTLEDLWKQAGGMDPQRAFTYALLAIAQLLCPFAPHIAEELWQSLGETGLCCDSGWPQFDAEALVEAEVEMPVQVNGKIRARIKVASGAGEAEVIAAAKADPQTAQWLDGKELLKAMYVPGRLVAFVVK